MLKIGLTGGIGSGKSTVASIFEVLGIPVYYADTEAKRLMNDNPAIRKSIENNFGKECYVNEQLDRAFLSSIVFTDKKKLALLNEITHPVTIADAEKWMSEQQTPYAIKEAALIFESKSDDRLDYIIGVHASIKTRVARVIKRDQSSEEKVIAIIERQMNEEDKMSLCNFVIDNDESNLLTPQVIALHEKLLVLSK